MQKWEYLFWGDHTGDVDGWINGRELPDRKKVGLCDSFSTLGDEGWELVGIDLPGTCTRFIFKRPKAE